MLFVDFSPVFVCLLLHEWKTISCSIFADIIDLLRVVFFIFFFLNYYSVIFVQFNYVLNFFSSRVYSRKTEACIRSSGFRKLKIEK